MSENRDDLDKFHKHITNTILDSDFDDFAKYFNNSFLAGDNTLYQKNISETKKFDSEWISTIESYFPSIDKITRNPKNNLKYEKDIVAVEKARKIDSESVRHLASHTQLIKDIDEDNNVTPSKIQVSFAEADYAIYENRFIATLIKRLFLFVRNRYEIIKNNVESYQRDHLNAESKFTFNNTEVEMSLDIVVKKDLDDHSINEHNMDLLKRAEKLNILISGLHNSQFMKLLSGAPAVHPPIMKTNIIMHNSDFRNAYNLWIWMDRYSAIAYDVDVREKDLEFDDRFKKDLEGLFLINYSTILGDQRDRLNKYNTPDGYTEYTKKRTKIAKDNAKDFVENPDQIQIEDTALNEYFLNKYNSLLDQSIASFTREDEETGDAEIKKALRQTIEILNGLYESKFNYTEEETDDAVFRRLVKEEDIEKEYNAKKDQLRYADMIRDAKRVDYNNSIRIERKLIKDLERLNKKMIADAIEKRKYEEEENKIKALEALIDAKKKENEELEKRIAEIDDISKLTKEEEEKLVNERNMANMRFQQALKEYDAKMKEKFEQERQKLLAALEAEKEKNRQLRLQLQEALKRRKEELAKMLADERSKAKEAFEEEKKKLLDHIASQRQDLIGLLDKLRKEFKLEQQRAKEDESQRIKEEMAKFKVSKYEERLIEQAELERINSNFESERSKETNRINNEFEQEKREKIAIQKVKDHEALEKARRAAQMEENKKLAEIRQQEELRRELEEMQAKEELDRQNAIRLAEQERLRREEALRYKQVEDERRKAELDQEKESKFLERQKEKELEDAKFEAQRLAIEESLKAQIEEDNALKLQKDNEEKARLRVLKYEEKEANKLARKKAKQASK